MNDDRSKPAGWPTREERKSISTHETVIENATLTYTATAGTVTLRSDKDEEEASLFYVSYILQDAPADRPVTFCFNGGPGSSAVWLHLGAFGPRRVALPDTLTPPPPPYALEDNLTGILDLTDLVFIDPVGTGFSRLLGESEASSYHSIDGDVASVGRFITLWLSRNQRWNAPRYLAGESYGTTRAAALASWLMARGIVTNGLVLLSLALDFQTFVFEPSNPLPSLLYLPSYTACAWYHNRLDQRPQALDPLLAEVRAWALDVYAPALLRGASLSDEDRVSIAAQLAKYTGLPAAAIADRDLHIDYLWFAKALLGEHGRTIGRLDGRYADLDLDTESIRMSRDPSFDAPYGPYAALFNDYVRGDLGYETDDLYNVLSLEVNEGWDWKQKNRMGFPSTAEALRAAMVGNRHLKVLVANGLFDLATPFFAAEYTLQQLRLDAQRRENLHLTYYEAGHMMYFHEPSRHALKADLKWFYGRS